MKDELGRKVRMEFVGLGPKTYSYLTDDGSCDKKLNEQIYIYILSLYTF